MAPRTTSEGPRLGRASSVVMRVDRGTYDRVRRMAEVERRTMLDELAILVERGLKSSGLDPETMEPLVDAVIAGR